MKKNGQFKRYLYGIVLVGILASTFAPPIFTAMKNIFYRENSQSSSKNYGRVVDKNTMDDYLTTLNLQVNSRTAGKIWSDKTVLKNQTDLDMETDGWVGNVQSSSDFLHVFSTVGSSLTINEPIPLDIVFAVDISGSMGSIDGKPVDKEEFVNQDDSIVPIIQTVKAINSAVDTILEKSPNSRIGLVVYGTTAAVLLPLDHYSITNTPFLQVSYNANQGGYETQGVHFLLELTVQQQNGNTVTYYADNAGSTNNQTHNTNINGNSTIQGTGGKTEGTGSKAYPYHVGHITNPQAGLAASMEELIQVENTTWVSGDGSTHSRIPALIHLTDGQATDIAYISDPPVSDGKDWEQELSNWYHVNWNYDLAYNSEVSSDGQTLYNTRQLNADSGFPAIVFQTVMTASFYKSAVENHYNTQGSNASPVKLLTYSIYANDAKPYNSLTGGIKATIDGILNPTKMMNGHLEGDEIYNDIISQSQQLIQRWQNSEEIHQEFLSTNTVKIPLNASQEQLKDRPYGVTEQDVIKNIGYVSDEHFYTSKFSELSQVFDNIVSR